MKYKLRTWPRWAQPIALSLSRWVILPRPVRIWFFIRSLPAESVYFTLLLHGIFEGAPIEKIQFGQSCSWEMTPEQSEKVNAALEAYVKEEEAKRQ